MQGEPCIPTGRGVPRSTAEGFIRSSVTVIRAYLDAPDPHDALAAEAVAEGRVPEGMRHFAVARGNVVQIHGIGPFKAVFSR